MSHNCSRRIQPADIEEQRALMLAVIEALQSARINPAASTAGCSPVWFAFCIDRLRATRKGTTEGPEEKWAELAIAAGADLGLPRDVVNAFIGARPLKRVSLLVKP